MVFDEFMLNRYGRSPLFHSTKITRKMMVPSCGGQWTAFIIRERNRRILPTSNMQILTRWFHPICVTDAVASIFTFVREWKLICYRIVFQPKVSRLPERQKTGATHPRKHASADYFWRLINATMSIENHVISGMSFDINSPHPFHHINNWVLSTSSLWLQ